MSGEKKREKKLFIRIPEDLDEMLREYLPLKKGVLSKFVAEAIREKLERELQKRESEKK